MQMRTQVMHVWHILYSDVLTFILAIIIILTYVIGLISNDGTTIKIAYTNTSPPHKKYRPDTRGIKIAWAARGSVKVCHVCNVG
jgi:hypothetical protein